MQQATSTPSLIHPDWKRFLSARGAIMDNEQVTHFGNPEAERHAAADTDILADLSHLALWRAEGADAQNFLQGQLSNDIRQAGTTHAQLSAYCNPKGRMLAIFQIFVRGDAYYLQLPAVLAETTLKRLRMFILRSRVKLEPAGAELAHVGLSGPNSESLLKDLLGQFPVNPWDCLAIDEISVIRLPGPHPRFQLVAPPKRLEPLWEQLAPRATAVGAGPWSWLDIQAGIPVVQPGTVEEFVPQMANLEVVGGVSFTKGCYPGQEIVARMHYLGRLKQRMVRAHVDADITPQPGMPVYAPDLPGQSTGAVVAAQPSPAGGHDLLAVVQISSRDAGELHLNSADGARLTLLGLPYSLDTAAPT